MANIRAPGELQLSVGLLFAPQQIPLGVPQAQYTLSWSVQRLRRLSLHGINITPFRIVRCNRQAALYSDQFNYTPRVIRRTDKNKQLTIINRNK
jgi:hypothetical protein